MGAADIAVRLAQYISLLTLFGLAAFAVYAREASSVLRPAPLLSLALAALLASFAGLLLLAAGMTGDISSAADPAILWTVILGSGAGHAWAVRCLALAAGALLFRSVRPKAMLLCSAIALASLAWGGHAAADDGVFGAVRLAADCLHLLAAGIWIGALVMFARLIVSGADAQRTGQALTDFAGVGSAVVAVLIASGLLNALHMVEWRPWPVLTTSLWGALLLAKLALFAVMLALAAANRFVLTPRLLAAEDATGGVRRRLRHSLLTETALAFGVVALVSLLGALSPPAGG